MVIHMYNYGIILTWKKVQSGIFVEGFEIFLCLYQYQLPGTCRTLTIVLPHWNSMLCKKDMTPHPITVYRHRDALLKWYPLM